MIDTAVSPTKLLLYVKQCESKSSELTDLWELRIVNTRI